MNQRFHVGLVRYPAPSAGAQLGLVIQGQRDRRKQSNRTNNLTIVSLPSTRLRFLDAMEVRNLLLLAPGRRNL